MLMKVYDGTRVLEGESLCDTCRHSRIIRGRRMEEEIVICDAVFHGTLRVTFKVTSCSTYVDDREPSYEELMQKAWILRPASKRRPAGFMPAADFDPQALKRKTRFESDDEEY
jgi:hypothetical protein